MIIMINCISYNDNINNNNNNNNKISPWSNTVGSAGAKTIINDI